MPPTLTRTAYKVEYIKNTENIAGSSRDPGRSTVRDTRIVIDFKYKAVIAPAAHLTSKRFTWELTPCLQGGVLTTRERPLNRCDYAPKFLQKPLDVEAALVDLWRTLHGMPIHWKKLCMGCDMTIQPRYHLYLTVPPEMEELNLISDTCRLTVDLCEAQQLQKLELCGAFKLFVGGHTLDNLTTLQLKGRPRLAEGMKTTSMSLGFLHTILQCAPNLQILRAEVVRDPSQSQRVYSTVTLPHLTKATLHLERCTSQDIRGVLGALEANSLENFTLDIRGGDISTSPLGLASFLEHSPPYEGLVISIEGSDDAKLHVEEVIYGLRHCPDIIILVLTAALCTPEFLAAFTLRDNEAEDICPVLLSLTFLGKPPSPPAQLLEMLRSRRGTLENFYVENISKEEILSTFGPEIEEFLDAGGKGDEETTKDST